MRAPVTSTIHVPSATEPEVIVGTVSVPRTARAISRWFVVWVYSCSGNYLVLVGDLVTNSLNIMRRPVE